MTNWGGHIDVLVVAAVIIIFQTAINIYFFNRIKRLRKNLYAITRWTSRN